MGASISLRDDFDGASLRRLARTSKSANQARRLLALAEIYDGGRRTSAARIGGVGLQIVRDLTGCFALMPVVLTLMMPSAERLSKWSSPARSPRSMALFAGD
jgi:hypothetical protein